MFTEADQQRIAAAVTAAEASSDGEIVTVLAAESDSYNDVVLHWAVLALFLAVAIAAAIPGRRTSRCHRRDRDNRRRRGRAGRPP